MMDHLDSDDGHQLTPPKQNRELGSRPRNSSPKPYLSGFRSHRRGNIRTSKDLSSDSDEEILEIQKSIKRFKIDDYVAPFCPHPELPSFERDDMHCGQILKDDGFQMQTEDYERVMMKRPTLTKKESACEMDLVEYLPRAPLYRMNSTIVRHSQPQICEYLGDNVYIKNILKEASCEEDHAIKFMPRHSSRFYTDYEILQNMGKVGTFSGTAYKCINRLDRMVYMIKEIKGCELLQEETLKAEFLKTQMELHNRDSDNSLVRFFQSWSENGFSYMVYEPATYTLLQVNQEKRKLTEQEVRGLLVDIGQSLQFLESQGKSHLNLRPSNILNCRGKFKLMDMYCDSQTLVSVSTCSHPNKYLSPELDYPYLVNQDSLWRADVFSLGAIIVENITGKPHVSLKSFTIGERLGLKRSLQSMFQYSPSLIKLLMRMLSLNSNRRPSIKEMTGVEELRNKGNLPVRKLSM